MAGWTDRLASVLSGGFGPEVVKGLIEGAFEKISTKQCRQYITENRSLSGQISETQWELLRKTQRSAKINLCYEEIVSQLEANRPDVLGTVMTTDGGVLWLRRQVEEVKAKLNS